MEKEQKNTVKNTLIVFFFAIGAKLLSLIRESVIAAFAGTSLEADAYYMVMSIYMVFELGMSASIYQCFFPLYKELSLEEGNKKQRIEFVNSILLILVLISIFFVLIEIFFGEYIVKIMGIGFDLEKIKITECLLSISAPMLIFVVVSECFSSVLRSHNKFIWSQIREWMTHVLAILFILLFYKKIGIYAMGIGLLMGAIFRMLIQVPPIMRIHSFEIPLEINSSKIKIFFQRVPATLVTASIVELKNISDKMIASTLVTGAISALNYGYRLESAISGIIFNSISTGIYPNIVQLYLDKEKKKLEELMENVLQIVSIIIIPLVVFSLFFGEDIVALVYKRGVFGENEVLLTSKIFLGYIFGTIFSGSSIILNNIFYASGDTKILMKINFIDLVVNVILNIVLVRKIGVIGLPIATSIASLTSFSIKIFKVRKYLKLNYYNLILQFFKIVIAAILTGILSFYISKILKFNFLLELILDFTIMFFLYIICIFVFKVQIFFKLKRHIKFNIL